MSAVESIATAMMSAAGARTRGGLCTTASALMPNATISSRPSAVATPTITPRWEKRALSVTTGIASQERIAMFAPPMIAIAAAMITSEPAQAANMRYSGRALPSMRASASGNRAAASSNGTIVQ